MWSGQHFSLHRTNAKQGRPVRRRRAVGTEQGARGGGGGDGRSQRRAQLLGKAVGRQTSAVGRQSDNRSQWLSVRHQQSVPDKDTMASPAWPTRASRRLPAGKGAPGGGGRGVREDGGTAGPRRSVAACCPAWRPVTSPGPCIGGEHRDSRVRQPSPAAALRAQWPMGPLLSDPEGGGVLGALASPGRPTHQPTHTRNNFLRQKMKFTKGDGTLRPILGTETFLWPQTPRVTFRLVVVPLRGPGQSPVLPFACCVGSLRSVGRCGRWCSCWCCFRVRGAQYLVCWGCAECGRMCRLRVSGAQ